LAEYRTILVGYDGRCSLAAGLCRLFDGQKVQSPSSQESARAGEGHPMAQHTLTHDVGLFAVSSAVLAAHIFSYYLVPVPGS
jgi:hypothetical protein